MNNMDMSKVVERRKLMKIFSKKILTIIMSIIFVLIVASNCLIEDSKSAVSSVAKVSPALTLSPTFTLTSFIVVFEVE